jgi:hypothetical protein
VSTRLERSTRDYAIAVLSAPGRPNVWVAASAVERATVYGPVYSAWTRNIDTDALGDLVHVVSPRILRARVALFLRLVRRCEAWERGNVWHDDEPHELFWHLPHCRHANDWPDSDGFRVSHDTWMSAPRPHRCTMVPWKPLWTDPTCPPHDPSTTPAQRRASRRGMVDR